MSWEPIVGAVASTLLSQIFKDNPEQFRPQSTKTPAQTRQLNNIANTGGLQNNPLYQQGSSYLQNILSGNPEAFKAFEAPYLQQFNQQIIPGITERFAGMGTGAGAGSSSGLYNSLGFAGQNLQQNLAALKSGLMQNASSQALNYAQQPVSNQLNAINVNPFDTAYTPSKPGINQGFAQILPDFLKLLYNQGSGGQGTSSPPVPGFQGIGNPSSGGLNSGYGAYGLPNFGQTF